MVFLATVDPSPRPQPMKFPVFSQLAGEFLAIQRRVRSRLPPPAASLVRTGSVDGAMGRKMKFSSAGNEREKRGRG